ncbi:pitrilysin family protein [uncultured Butyricimonas sp.]|uniref:M16 family metallopeptidase n=1 Tax=uncultured Butyricimonas sp. TaxID=1268785 RepID=UPI0026DC2DA4|nr:insulinase family protein [uncultured Butyricimonas sp.]
MKKAILLFVVSLLFMAGLSAQVDLQKKLPRDPEMVVGRLSNGMTYYIRHNDRPRNQANFYLVRNAGFLLEEGDEQRGVAHFLEHMAFQGSEHFPGREMIKTLERHGVLYGHDINAVTSDNHTVYLFNNVPTGDERFLDTCVMILRDWSYYLTIDEDRIDREKKVIEEEWNMLNTPEKRAQDQIARVLLQGSPYADRDALGTPEAIRAIDARKLREFYHEWYRSDLTAVVIVGDIDVKQMERRVKKILSKIPAVKKPTPRPEIEIPAHEEMYYCLATDPGINYTTLNVITMVPEPSREEKNTYAYLKEEILIRCFNTMMGKRFAKLLAQPNCPLAQGGINFIPFKRGYYSYQLGGMPKPGQDEAALRTLLMENERVRRHGFMAGELEEVKASLLKELELGYRARGEVKHDAYCQVMRDHYLNGAPLVADDEKYAFQKSLIPALTVEDVNAKVSEWDTPGNKTVVISGSEMAWHLMEEEVKDIMAEVKNVEVEPYVHERAVTGDEQPLLAEQPSGSPVTSERELADFDAVEWTLANGVKVVYRESDLECNKLSLKAYSPGGTSLYDLDMLPTVEMAVPLVRACGLGDHDAATLKRWMASKGVKCEASLGELNEYVTASALPEDAESLLQLVYLTFARPRIDREALGKVMAQRLMQSRMQGRNVLQDTVTRLQNGCHPRALLKNAVYLGKVDLDKVGQVYRERFSNAGDFTFFITGNLPAAELKPLVEKYLGALPSTSDREKWIDRGVRPLRGHQECEIEFMGLPTSFVVLSASKEMEDNIRHAVCLQALKSILQTRCMNVIREKEGGTYAVNVNESVVHEPVARYYLIVEFQCDPSNASRLKGIVLGELERLRQQAPTRDELMMALNSIRKKEGEARETNVYWQEKLVLYYKTGLNQADAREFEEVVDKLTPADFLSFMQSFWKDIDLTGVVFKPAN